MASVGGNGQDVMANLAARLMGRRPGVPQQSPSASPSAAASTPRTMPSQQLTSPHTNVQAPSIPAAAQQAQAQTPPRPAQAPASNENIPPSPVTVTRSAATPTTAEQDVTVTAAHRGPSLLGDADQLAVSQDSNSANETLTLTQEAREFSQATAGRTRSRPNRNRIVSTERSSSSTSSGRTTAAANLARSGGYPPLSAVPRSRPTTRSETGSQTNSPAATNGRTQIASPPVTGIAALHSRPPVAPAQPAAQAWNALATKPVDRKEVDGNDVVTKSLEKVEISHAHPTTPSPAKKAEAAEAPSDRQMKDITNTLKERATDIKSPPHLRTKATATVAADIKPTTDVGTARNPIVIDDGEKKADPMTNGTNGFSSKLFNFKENKPPSKAAEHKPASINELESKPALVNGTTTQHLFSGAASVPTSLKEPENKPSLVNSASTKASPSTSDETLLSLDAVKKTLAVVSERLGAVEEDNLDLQKQIETMLQSEERRKFLGTDSAKVPFSLEVKLRKYRKHSS